MESDFDHSVFSQEFFLELQTWKFILKKKLSADRFSDKAHWGIKGSGEFAGFTLYNPGDDLRHVDWNVYARTQELVVKNFFREGEFRIFVFLDCSGSMGLGKPSKFEACMKWAASILYLALHSGYRVDLGILKSEQGCQTLPVFSLSDFRQALCFLSWHKPKGILRWADVLAPILPKNCKFLIFFCTDLLCCNEFPAILNRLVQNGHALALIHILSKEEIEPSIHGPVELWNVETGESFFCMVDEELIRNYKEKLCLFQKYWQNFCLQHRLGYTWGTSDACLYPLLYPLVKSLGWFL